MSQAFFQPGQHRWREVLGDPELSYKVRHDYTILGHDLEAGTLDMVVRWEGDGGAAGVGQCIAIDRARGPVLDGERGE